MTNVHAKSSAVDTKVPRNVTLQLTCAIENIACKYFKIILKCNLVSATIQLVQTALECPMQWARLGEPPPVDAACTNVLTMRPLLRWNTIVQLAMTWNASALGKWSFLFQTISPVATRKSVVSVF